MADLEDRDDVGVIERRSRARLLCETQESFAVGQEAGRQNLQGHLPPETGIASPVDLSHPPRTQRKEDFKGPEPGTGLECHVSVQDNRARRPGRLSSRSERL